MSQDDFDSVFKIVNKVFGTTSTYNYLSGGSTEIQAVFDNSYIEINGISTLKPTLKIRLADLTSPPEEGDTVVIGSVTYKVFDQQVDGVGTSILILEKQ